MRPLTEREIRAAFLNCSKGEAKRLSVPRNLDQQPWGDLDFFGWRDPQAPDRTYLAVDLDGVLRAVAMRSPNHLVGQGGKRSMCSLCLTTHSAGVSLMVAPRAGKAGKEGSSVGAYICSDLACSLYLRGKKDAGPGSQLQETMTLDEKVERVLGNLAKFLARVTS
ncbi:FBP domain-containing protein [Streptomyces sp. NPDC088788]|uniref:FBP domain-containing protein n=1 Tax=Streptomyces sp. NPDC088788 TaxID=3365898 RepID=UPI00380AD587